MTEQQQPMSSEEFEQLLIAYLEDDISEADAVRFNRELASSADRQQAFIQSCLLGQAIAESRNETLLSLDVVEADTPAEDDVAIPSSLLRNWTEQTWRWLNQPMTVSVIVSGLLMTIIVLSMALIVPDWERADPVAEAPSVEFVARITRTSEATFDKTSDGNLKNRDLFDDDKIVLNSGLVVIEYDTGARVVLEGPATYEIKGTSGGFLKVGKLAARVDGPVAEFSVATPLAKVVDLGTEFGIEVQASGATDVVVTEGEVALEREAGNGLPAERIRLIKGQGGAIESWDGPIARRDNADTRSFTSLQRHIRPSPTRQGGPELMLVDVNNQKHETFDNWSGLTAPAGRIDGVTIELSGVVGERNRHANRGMLSSGSMFIADGVNIDSLVDDFVFNNVADAAIEVTISGLAAGTYEVESWHWDPLNMPDLTRFTFDVAVNGQLVHDDIVGVRLEKPLRYQMTSDGANPVVIQFIGNDDQVRFNGIAWRRVEARVDVEPR